MKVTIEVTQRIESKGNLEIELPYYTRNGNAVYKVYSNNRCLLAWKSDISENNQLEQQNISLAFMEGWEEITAEIFNEQYEKVINVLNSI